MKFTQAWMLLFLLAGIMACQPVNPNYQEETAAPEYFHRSMKKLSDVIVHGIFSPPVASRIYSYASIAAYEAAIPGQADYRSLAGQVHGLGPAPKPDPEKTYCFPLASLQAFLNVGTALIFSEQKMDAFREELYAEIQDIQMPRDVYARSLAYGDAVSHHILEWADKDMYKQTRTYPKYSITDDPSKWQPTPPDYMDGIEPHWNKIRTLVLDSANQFTPPPPTDFSLKPGS